MSSRLVTLFPTFMDPKIMKINDLYCFITTHGYIPHIRHRSKYAHEQSILLAILEGNGCQIHLERGTVINTS